MSLSHSIFVNIPYNPIKASTESYGTFSHPWQLLQEILRLNCAPTPNSKEHAKLTFVFDGYGAKHPDSTSQQVFGKIGPLLTEIGQHQVEVRPRQPGTSVSLEYQAGADPFSAASAVASST